MAKFFVGQRVRIKWSDNFPELAGNEGVIFRQARRGPMDHHESDWVVKPNCWSSEECPRTRITFAPRASQLEPITDRNEVTTWEKCAWSPHGVSA